MPEPTQQVSVVVSCYNYGEYLTGAVQSALAQSHRDLEIIIVDDGSTDDTERIAAKLVASDPRVSYLRQSNKGQASAKNAGILRGSGSFVAFLDADDRWHPDKLEKQLKLFAAPQVGVVYSRMRAVGANGAPLLKQDEAPSRTPRRGRVTDALFVDNFIPFSSAVVRRTVFEKVGAMDPDLAMGIDWDLWLRASVDFQFDFVDEELLDYRVGHVGQMSHRQEERYGWAERIMTRFLERHPHTVTPAVVTLAWAHTYNNRGLFFRRKDLLRSTGYYVRSLKTRPAQINAYRGLLGNAVAAVRSVVSGGNGVSSKENP